MQCGNPTTRGEYFFSALKGMRRFLLSRPPCRFFRPALSCRDNEPQQQEVSSTARAYLLRICRLNCFQLWFISNSREKHEAATITKTRSESSSDEPRLSRWFHRCSIRMVLLHDSRIKSTGHAINLDII